MRNGKCDARPVRKRPEPAWAALLGNGMAWFGAAGFVLSLAGEQFDTIASGAWPRVVGFVLVAAVGVGLAVGGVLDNHRIRVGRTRRA